MGASIFIMVWLMLHQVFLYSGVQGQEDVPCIGNYEQLKAALRNNTDNVKKLLNTFYPINKKPVHFVTITYCLNYSSFPEWLFEPLPLIPQNYTFHWAANSLMLTYGPDLLSALVLNFVTFNSAEVTLYIDPPFCANDTFTIIPDLLETLTSWVSICYYYASSLYVGMSQIKMVKKERRHFLHGCDSA